VRAFDAVTSYCAQNPPNRESYLTATGSFAGFTIIGGTFYIGWEQQAASLPKQAELGCYPTEAYIVNRTTFAVTPAVPPCPK
jgi:hypothetical protein